MGLLSPVLDLCLGACLGFLWASEHLPSLFWALGPLLAFSGLRSFFSAFSGLGASSEPLSASWPLARLFWGSSQPFLGLGSGPFIEVEQIPFQDASRSFMVFPSFSTLLAGFQASIYLNPLCWAPCFNLLKPPFGLLASIYLNLFVAFLVDSPYQIRQAPVEPQFE